jgi:hypothetical protein
MSDSLRAAVAKEIPTSPSCGLGELQWLSALVGAAYDVACRGARKVPESNSRVKSDMQEVPMPQSLSGIFTRKGSGIF